MFFNCKKSIGFTTFGSSLAFSTLKTDKQTLTNCEQYTGQDVAVTDDSDTKETQEKQENNETAVTSTSATENAERR